MTELVRQLTYSRVVSTIALFLALGGGAYALSLGKGDVTSRAIENGTVRGVDIKKNSLKGRQIGERGLRLPLAAASAGSVPAFACDLAAAGATPCGRLTVQAPTRGRLFAMASGSIMPPEGGVGLASCSLVVDGAQLAKTGNRSGGQARDFALSGVSATVPAGEHEIGVTCERSSIDPASRIEGDSLSAVLIAGAK